jgi:predicted nuclease of restriction endonuclease-like (RecB) superfamily
MHGRMLTESGAEFNGMCKNINTNEYPELDVICNKAIGYVNQARQKVIRSVNHEQVIAYWKIGQIIVEDEQKGQTKAEYGSTLIKILSTKLNHEFKRGFSVSNLRYMRQFYLIYKERIHHEARGKSTSKDFNPNLSWTHYRLLMSELREGVRNFYEIEAVKNHWSTPQFERQMTSFLYERLSASKDKKGIMSLSNKGQIIEKPEDALKNPVVLDFLGYKEHHQYTETDLETAIIDHLQEFLLEMGKGFAFVSRQKKNHYGW